MKENQNVEWKQSWRDDYLKWICGFANADGGVLEIGRNDAGAVVGVKANPKHLIKALGEEEAKRMMAIETHAAPVKTAVKTAVKTPVKILELLATNPLMTLADVALEIEKSLRAVELASSKLVKEGRLRYVGPQKGGHWEVLK